MIINELLLLSSLLLSLLLFSVLLLLLLLLLRRSKSEKVSIVCSTCNESHPATSLFVFPEHQLFYFFNFSSSQCFSVLKYL